MIVQEAGPRPRVLPCNEAAAKAGIEPGKTRGNPLPCRRGNPPVRLAKSSIVSRWPSCARRTLAHHRMLSCAAGHATRARTGNVSRPSAGAGFPQIAAGPGQRQSVRSVSSTVIAAPPEGDASRPSAGENRVAARAAGYGPERGGTGNWFLPGFFG